MPELAERLFLICSPLAKVLKRLLYYRWTNELSTYFSYISNSLF